MNDQKKYGVALQKDQTRFTILYETDDLSVAEKILKEATKENLGRNLLLLQKSLEADWKQPDAKQNTKPQINKYKFALHEEPSAIDSMSNNFAFGIYLLAGIFFLFLFFPIGIVIIIYSIWNWSNQAAKLVGTSKATCPHCENTIIIENYILFNSTAINCSACGRNSAIRKKEDGRFIEVI